jgi:hypothetical protein
MQRAVGRAYLRLKGEHPRRPPSRFSLVMEIACDALLVSAFLALTASAVVLAWTLFIGLQATALLSALALAAFAALLLLVWEKVAWEPFVDHLSELS